MLTEQTLLFLSLSRYDDGRMPAPWRMATELSYHNRVIWVDHPYTFAEVIRRYFHATVKKRRTRQGKASLVKNVVVLYAPFIWPVGHLPTGGLYRFFSRQNHKILAHAINRYLNENKIQSLIYINSSDFYFPELPVHLRVAVKAKVYHCVDAIAQSLTTRHKRYQEHRAAQHADMIISTSSSYQKKFKERGFKKSYCVPQPVNYALFARTVDVLTRVHPKLAGLRTNVMGFLGRIDSSIDYPLLQRVLQLLPDWTLVMAGQVELSQVPDELIDHPRVHFTGAIPRAEEPLMMKGFTVAIAPFVCNASTATLYPLKVYEYLAAGRPVVTTGFNRDELNKLTSVAEIADDVEDFADAIVKQAAGDMREKARMRMKVASQNTWHERASLFGQIIASELRQSAIELV